MVHYFLEGGGFMWPILITLLFGLGFAIERFYSLMMSAVDSKSFFDEIIQAIDDNGTPAAVKVCEETDGPVSSIFYAGLSRIHRGLGDVEKAIQNACKRAIEYYSGVEISSIISDTQISDHNEILMDSFVALTKQTTQGIILEKQVTGEQIISRANRLLKLVKVKIKVGKQQGKKDPFFTLKGSLNREYFKNGEQIQLNIKSSKDCYITVLNICSNDSVYILFPNQFRKNNFLQAGQTFLLPNQKDKQMGLNFKVNLDSGKDKDVEMIKIIATKQKIDFSSVYSFSAYGTYKSTLRDLQHWLLKIPRNQIEELDFQYFVVK